VSNAQNNNHWAASGDTKRTATDFSSAPLNDDGTDIEKPLRPMFSWIDYGKRKVDRTKYHIGEGFLEVGCFIFLIGPSYSGKSTLIAQLSISFALAQSCFIFKVHRSLRSMVVQAEDPENKLVKMGQMFHRMGLNPSQIKQAHENTAVLVIDDIQDSRAVSEIERHALDFKPDIIWLNPLTSYLSAGVYKEEPINKFLRVDFGPMLKRIGASGIIAHHPPKPALDTKNLRDLTAFELQYGGAGMAALTNAARANAFLAHVDGDVFKLATGKGYQELGTKEPVAYLRRSLDSAGIMLWEPCDQSQADEATEKAEKRKAKEQTKFVSYDRLLKALKPTEKYSPDKVVELAKKHLNKGKDWAKAAMRQLVQEKKLAKSGKKNPKGQPFVFYHLPTILEPGDEEKDSSEG
jgi:RecA-family ATPase